MWNAEPYFMKNLVDDFQMKNYKHLRISRTDPCVVQESWKKKVVFGVQIAYMCYHVPYLIKLPVNSPEHHCV